MATKSDPVPYEAMERRALDDLAARTLADPEAPDAHVEAARKRLQRARFTSDDMVRAVAGLTPLQIIALRRILDPEHDVHNG